MLVSWAYLVDIDVKCILDIYIYICEYANLIVDVHVLIWVYNKILVEIIF